MCSPIPPLRRTTAASAADEMRALAADALTLIQPPTVADLRARLPRGPQSPEKVVIVECWDDCYPYRVMPQSNLQQALLAAYGPAGAGRLKPDDVSTDQLRRSRRVASSRRRSRERRDEAGRDRCVVADPRAHRVQPRRSPGVRRGQALPR